MGLWFSKRENLEFMVLPSEEVSGPLGLGDPDSTNLNNVEKETLIPALMLDRARTKQCWELWNSKTFYHQIFVEWTKCAQSYRWSAVIVCRQFFNDAHNCNKQCVQDPQFYEEMKQLYLKMRSDYRRTGVEQRIVRTEE